MVGVTPPAGEHAVALDPAGVNEARAQGLARDRSSRWGEPRPISGAAAAAGQGLRVFCAAVMIGIIGYVFHGVVSRRPSGSPDLAGRRLYTLTWASASLRCGPRPPPEMIYALFLVLGCELLPIEPRFFQAVTVSASGNAGTAGWVSGQIPRGLQSRGMSAGRKRRGGRPATANAA